MRASYLAVQSPSAEQCELGQTGTSGIGQMFGSLEEMFFELAVVCMLSISIKTSSP